MESTKILHQRNNPIEIGVRPEMPEEGLGELLEYGNIHLVCYLRRIATRESLPPALGHVAPQVWHLGEELSNWEDQKSLLDVKDSRRRKLDGGNEP